MMNLFFKIRDFFKDPRKKIEKIHLKRGDYVLEYGCGPGSFTVAIAERIGPKGKVYAADIHPLAPEKVIKKAEKNELENIETIITDCKTELEKNSIDKVILIDILHDLENYEENLKEFYRILKNDGKLWVDDHHFEGKQIKFRINKNGLFEYISKKDSLYEFRKNFKS